MRNKERNILPIIISIVVFAGGIVLGILSVMLIGWYQDRSLQDDAEKFAHEIAPFLAQKGPEAATHVVQLATKAGFLGDVEAQHFRKELERIPTIEDEEISFSVSATEGRIITSSETMEEVMGLYPLLWAHNEYARREYTPVSLADQGGDYAYEGKQGMLMFLLENVTPYNKIKLLQMRYSRMTEIFCGCLYNRVDSRESLKTKKEQFESAKESFLELLKELSSEK